MAGQVEIVFTEELKKSYKKLPSNIQKKFKKCIGQTDHGHPKNPDGSSERRVFADTPDVQRTIGVSILILTHTQFSIFDQNQAFPLFCP